MTFLFVLIFVLGFCGSFGNGEEFALKSYKNYETYDQLMGYGIVGTDNRDKEDIWRPCSLNDYKCMGHFLSSNSECVPAYGYTPDPIRMPIEKVFLPVASMTITHLDAEVRGFRKARVTEFFVNKATGNVVVAVTVPVYNFTAYGFHTYQREAKEPLILSDYNSYEKDDVVYTTTIPKVPHLRLELADVFTKVSDTPLRSYVGPGTFNSKDLAVMQGSTKFHANIDNIIAKESFLTHSYFLMSTFIQKELCDFGLDTNKNYNGYVLFRRRYTRY